MGIKCSVFFGQKYSLAVSGTQKLHRAVLNPMHCYTLVARLVGLSRRLECR
jgi:hypothetical protein